MPVTAGRGEQLKTLATQAGIEALDIEKISQDFAQAMEAGTPAGEFFDGVSARLSADIKKNRPQDAAAVNPIMRELRMPEDWPKKNFIQADSFADIAKGLPEGKKITTFVSPITVESEMIKLGQDALGAQLSTVAFVEKQDTGIGSIFLALAATRLAEGRQFRLTASCSHTPQGPTRRTT